MAQQDKGWAWVIVSAVSLQNFFVVGLLKSFGLLFVEIVDTFNASASMTSAVLGLQAAAFCLAAPVSLHYLSTKFTFRTLMLVGAMISSTGIAISYVATDMIYLLFSCGIMIGIGNAFMHGPSLVMVSQYFKKRLSIANSIATGGGSLGQLAFPPLIYILFDFYLLRGTLLLIGGLMLNCCVSAALMRPFRNKESKHFEDLCYESRTGKIKPGDETEQEDEELIRDLVEKSTKLNKQPDEGIVLESTFEENSVSNVNVETNGSNQSRSCDANRCSLPALIDFSLCWNPIFILLQVASALGNTGSTLHAIYLVPHARDLGMDEKMTSLLVTILGAADVFGKLMCGIFADTGWVKRYKLLAVSMIFSGSLAQFLVYFTSPESIIAYCVIIGTIGGFYYSLLSPILVDFLGVNNLPRSLGITLCCEGVANTITPILLGCLRDSTGSYIASFHLIGVFLIISAVSLLCTRVVKTMRASYLTRNM